MKFPNICLFYRPWDGAPLFEEDVDLNSHHVKNSVPPFALDLEYKSELNEVIKML